MLLVFFSKQSGLLALCILLSNTTPALLIMIYIQWDYYFSSNMYGTYLKFCLIYSTSYINLSGSSRNVE